jgi:hypothetical protein
MKLSKKLREIYMNIISNKYQIILRNNLKKESENESKIDLGFQNHLFLNGPGIRVQG